MYLYAGVVVGVVVTLQHARHIATRNSSHSGGYSSIWRLWPIARIDLISHRLIQCMNTSAELHPFAAQEDDLIARAKARDADAFAGLVILHGQRLHRLLIRLLGNQADAEDVAQEVLIRAWRGLPSFQGNAQFSTWLHRIAVNEANRHLERKGIIRTVTIDEAPELADEPRHAPPAVVEARELREQVTTCVEELPPHYRAVIALVDIEGRANEDAAGLLQIGVRNLKSRLHRARTTVRRCVEAMMR